MLMCLGRPLWRGAVETDLLHELRHEMDLDEIEVGIILLRHVDFGINVVSTLGIRAVSVLLSDVTHVP